MWSDNETKRDLVNFSHVAEIAAERIVGANGEPLSIGISGDWGVGKSSMMKLLRNSLEARSDFDIRFVEFNAWLYQSYDDARAALMEAITTALIQHAATAATPPPPGVVKRLLRQFARVNKFRAFSMLGATALDYFANGHVTGLGAAGVAAVTAVTDGNLTPDDADKVKKFLGDAAKGGKELLKDKSDDDNEEPTEEKETPQKAIQAFRDDLQETLREMGVTLVVLIDDLDRCLPKTAIATLEAMRLFLFLKHTAFVIAADEGMIRRAVRSHFDDATLSDDQVTNYFDKLIQLPIRVPPLGTQEVRAYLMMLFVDADPNLAVEQKDAVREAVCTALAQTWKGVRVDKAFLLKTIADCPPALLNRLGLAERITDILTTSPQIKGNPRLIKRFLNTLSLRSSMARIQNVEVDEEVLVKLLLFERCGDKDAYAALVRSVTNSDDGRANILADKEPVARKEKDAPALEQPWDKGFLNDWLQLDPPLAGVDLRGALYVGRENYPIVSRADELSSDAAAVLDLLLRMTSASPTVTAELRDLPHQDILRVADKVIARARQETTWGTPPILNGLQAVASATPAAAAAVTAFLGEIPSGQLRAGFVQRIAPMNWGKQVLTVLLSRTDLTRQVRNAITTAAKGDD